MSRVRDGFMCHMVAFLGVRVWAGMEDARRARRTSPEFARLSGVGFRLRRGGHLRGGFNQSDASAHPDGPFFSGAGFGFASPVGGFTPNSAAASALMRLT